MTGPPLARIARPQEDPDPAEVKAQCDAIAAEFKGWHAWRGGNGLWHAAGHGAQVHGDSAQDIAGQLRDGIAEQAAREKRRKLREQVTAR